MKKNRCIKLTAWLLAVIMVFGMCQISALAQEHEVVSQEYQTGIMIEEARLNDTFVESAVLTDNKGKEVTDLKSADPNNLYKLTLKVKEPEDSADTEKTLPENTQEVLMTYTLTNLIAKNGRNDVVTWEYEYNEETGARELIFDWVDGKKTSFTAEISVSPAYPAEKDLSGSYVLGTARKSMLGTRSFKDTNKGRDKLYASEYTETDSKIRPGTDENPVWVLEHVSGDYYTVRAQNTHKYIYISPEKMNNYLASSLYLVEGNSETAQKIKVTDAGGGYYSFIYEYKNNRYAINNSGNDKAGNSAVRGFGCWTYAGYDNEKFKLYSPSAFDNSATVDLSGSWVIINTSGKVSLTSETSQANRLNGMPYTLNNGVIVAEDDAVVFTFEHVIRDWYTVKTNTGYLNITAEGAKISSTPQRLMVKTNDNYSTIMLTTGEYVNSTDQYCSTYALNCGTEKIFGSVISKFTTNTRMQLVSPSGFANAETVAFLSFNKNEGTAAEVPQTITGEAGDKVVLPEMSGTKNSQNFIGWAEVSNIYAKVANDINHTYHVVYKPGTSYTLKAGNNTLYAVYNATDRNVTFGIRRDGVIVDEPNDNNVKDYIGHFTVNNILEEGHWVIDINSSKPVNGYYVENNVTAALKWMPSAEEIAAALKKEGNVEFDPETQYIHYYVLKYAGKWKIDGVIRNKAKVSVTYDMNAPAGVDKTKVTKMPGGYQVVPGTDILIGADENSTEIKRPGINGYYFMGWNTKKDGSGEYYSESSTIHLTENLYLYAQWADESKELLEIRITSNWPKGKTGYVGAKITLTAELTGFEGKEYTLQWQYTTDPESGNWTDVPDAHAINYTYILDEETTTYTWRCVAQDIR